MKVLVNKDHTVIYSLDYPFVDKGKLKLMDSDRAEEIMSKSFAKANLEVDPNNKYYQEVYHAM